MTDEEFDKCFLEFEFEIVDISDDDLTQENEEIRVPDELLKNSFNGNQHISILNYN